MGVRKKSGKLNKTHFDRLSKNYYDRNNSLGKIIKKGDAKSIRKVNEKAQKDIAKASSPEQKEKIKKKLSEDKKKLQSAASKVAPYGRFAILEVLLFIS